MIPQEIEKAAARHEFHDDHDGLLLNAYADEADDVGVIVLLQYPPLLQELLLLFVRQSHLKEFKYLWHACAML